jgi:hypothetical protein
MRQILDRSSADGTAQTKHFRRQEVQKTYAKRVRTARKNPNKSDFFYFYNFSNLISLSIFGFKVMSAALSP